MVAKASLLLVALQISVSVVMSQNPEPHPTAHLPVSDLSTRRALDWLLRQRGEDWGWGEDTPRAIVALQLANTTSWFGPDHLESQLSGKQMEMEILLQLWRHHEAPMSQGRLAQYTLALNAICKDPRQFHGHDLIGTLQHHEAELDFEFAYASLGVCSSGAHVRKRQIRRLLDIAEKVNDHNVDTLSMVLLALNCIVRDHRNRNLDHYVKKPSMGLAQQQHEDGSFGNLHSSALAIQALEAADESAGSAHWNRSAGISYLLSRQSADGAFGDVFTTTEAVLALGPRHLSAIRDANCNTPTPTVSRAPPVVLPPAPESNLTLPAPRESDIVAVTYTLWVGTNVTDNRTITVMPERNSTFYTVMQMAAEQDTHYQFTATEWPNGHYVHTIAGYKEEPTHYHYWLLYRVPELPDPVNPPSNNLITPVGVDGLLVEDGEHYLFWYKKL